MASFANWIIIMIIISSCWHKTNTFCSAFVFQHRIIESRPAEYNRPVFLSNWSAFTPDRWRGSCSSLMVKDTVTFLLGIVWLCGWACEWPEQGRTPAAILHFFFCQLLFSFPIRHSRALHCLVTNVTQRSSQKLPIPSPPQAVCRKLSLLLSESWKSPGWGKQGHPKPYPGPEKLRANTTMGKGERLNE